MVKNKEFNFQMKPVFKWLWLMILSGFIILIFIYLIISLTMIPDTEQLENPRFEVSTQIFDDEADGKAEEIGRYFKFNRDWLTFEELNPYLVQALVATEDERFFSHSGIDFKGTARAVFFMGRRGGASTITQQLAKQFFTKTSRNMVKRVWQKMKEWIIAIEFEKRYTKEEILAMYLNKYDFLYNANGIGAASKSYFGKDQKELSLDEAAVLIGMLKNPSLYNPQRSIESAFKRKAVVLKQMKRNQFIDHEEYEEYRDKPIDNSRFQRVTNYDGPAPYFRAELTKWLVQLFEDEKYRKPDGTKYNIYTDGLKIYTTIDLRMQIHAEEAMKEHMKRVQNRYFQVWKNSDPWTYRADDDEKNVRRESLNRKVESSERYQMMRSRILSPALAQFVEDFPQARLNNLDLRRMVREEAEPGYIADIVKKRWANKDQAAQYKKIMSHPAWPELSDAWKKLDGESKRAFNTKVNLKVFDYDEGEKTVLMTPLDSIRYHTQHMQFGSVSIDPRTGFVKTWVGGIGYDYFKYDHIQQSNRQIGSTFKPFLYTTVIQKFGMSPCMKVQDTQYEIPAGDPDFKLTQTWRPANASGFTGEWMTLKDGLKESKNSLSVYLMKQLGNVEVVRDFVANLGIDINKIPQFPSIALGTPELSVIDMAGAYTTYANNGVYSKPIFVKRIEDQNGRVIYNYVPEQRQALNPVYNHAMVDMLKYVVNHRAHLFKSEIAGKTGTTNDHVDGWFVGFTPNLASATWVGGSERWIRVLSIGDGQGSAMARPFFESFLLRVERDQNIAWNVSDRFVIPEGDLIEVDCAKYDQLVQSLSEEGTRRKRDEFEEEF